MKYAKLVRTETGDTGTFGTVEFDGQTLVSGELPERGNAPDISCIPPGVYDLKWLPSPHFKRNVYHFIGVPHREVCEVHPANLMGDVALGLTSQLHGCVAFGLRRGEVNDQDGIQGSQKAMKAFEEWGAGEDIEIEISAAYPETGEADAPVG